MSVAVFFLLVWSGTGVALAAVIKVSPDNVQAEIDGLPEGATKPDSLQEIIADSDTYVGDEDAIEFAPGT